MTSHKMGKGICTFVTLFLKHPFYCNSRGGGMAGSILDQHCVKSFMNAPLPNKGSKTTGMRDVTAKGRASVTQNPAISSIV